MMGARIMSNCEKYLGLPMVNGKSKVNTFKELQEKNNKEGDGVEGEVHIQSQSRDPNKNCGSSNTHLFHVFVQNPQGHL